MTPRHRICLDAIKCKKKEAGLQRPSKKSGRAAVFPRRGVNPPPARLVRAELRRARLSFKLCPKSFKINGLFCFLGLCLGIFLFWRLSSPLIFPPGTPRSPPGLTPKSPQSRVGKRCKIGTHNLAHLLAQIPKMWPKGRQRAPKMEPKSESRSHFFLSLFLLCFWLFVCTLFGGPMRLLDNKNHMKTRCCIFL